MLLNAGADVNAQCGRYGNALEAAAAVYEPSNDSMSCLAPEKTVLNSRIISGPITMSCTLLLGLSAVLLRYWYF
jgi:hypothetical protein